MKRSLTLIVAVGLTISECTSRKERSVEKISGTYVREYSYPVINPESGAEIGTRTIRDTIFILPNQTEYMVSNKKWKLNDYDKQGWQSMEHDQDRQMPPFKALFDNNTGTLSPESAPVPYITLTEGVLFKGERGMNLYRKLHE